MRLKPREGSSPSLGTKMLCFTSVEIIHSGIPTLQLEISSKHALFSRLLLFVLILIVLAQSVFIFYSRNQSRVLPKPQSEVVEKSVQIPDEDGFIYTRCYSGSRQPHYCNLYISSLFEPQEQLVYTFDFPDVEQTTFKAAFELSILGVADGKAVYLVSSGWDKSDGGKDNKSLGFIELSKGSNTEIYKQELSDAEAPNRLVDTYLDSINSKLYFMTNARQSLDHELIQYDLSEQTSTVILDGSTLDFPHVVLGASKDRVYLSPMEESPFSEPSWNKTFDLNTGVLSSVDKPKNRAVFDRSGQKVAYIEQEQTGQNTNLLKLIASNVDDTDKKIINSIQEPTAAGDYIDFKNYYFDLNAVFLSYQISSTNNYSYHSVQSYASFLTRDRDTAAQKEIVIHTPKNPDVYKWGENHEDLDFIYYQLDGGWYLLRFGSRYGPDLVANGVGDRRIIVADAQNVFILPY